MEGTFNFSPEVPDFSTSVDKSPLNQRGWTFQERLLPGRTAHITQHGVFWNCVELAAWEFDRQGRSTGPQLGRYSSTLHMYRRWKLEEEEEAAESFNRVSRAWIGLCKQYSTRQFSKPTDKLPALSGIAKLFHAKYYAGAEYLAGVWSSELPEALAWHTVFSTSQVSRVSESGKNSGLPSWSWASVQTKIETPLDEYFTPSGRGYSAEVVSVNVERATRDPFGHVRRGVLRLKGRFKFLKLRTRGFTSVLNEARVVFTTIIDGKEYGENENNAIHIDEPKHLNEMKGTQRTEFLLPAFILFENKTWDQWFILLLEQSRVIGETNVYRRIGLYVTSQTRVAEPDLKQGWEETEIDLT
ncbi:hypothetical protein PV08_11929 [Exophiala spinifera]|uniref:Heterokaryon incompatibility domain-containing protein n=1 Tax=Exophiala spinifera TaxID=91928 RepID=A0A0D2ASX2_9EURO|nr:uncharacterized protein PV08_11929 [Exophiala spinifera]KIW09828.1 hypothetical protein PV08_11929 [Exophiala spinifera]